MQHQRGKTPSPTQINATRGCILESGLSKRDKVQGRNHGFKVGGVQPSPFVPSPPVPLPLPLPLPYPLPSPPSPHPLPLPTPFFPPLMASDSEPKKNFFDLQMLVGEF
jgi:hypothetical protein